MHHAERNIGPHHHNPILKQEEDITETGIKECEILGEEFTHNKKYHIKAIITSPYLRCKHTAQIINKYLNVPIIEDDRFNEGNKEDADAGFTPLWERIMSGIDDVVKNEKYTNEDDILIVTSGINITGFICYFYNIDPKSHPKFSQGTFCSPVNFIFNKSNITRVELGILLDKDYDYYKDLIMKNNELDHEYIIETWDSYYTNKSLDNLTENEMKKACIRQRNVKFESSNEIKYSLQNMKIINKNDSWYSKEELDDEISELEKIGFKKIEKLTTHKIDYQLHLKNTSKVGLQFQLIDKIGLVLYYDNKKYYDLEEQDQRKKLIDELNSYGLSISYDTLGLDKLRTLYHGENKYSLNQNK